MFSSQVSPIAINFGASTVRLLQLAQGERPILVAAAEVEVPEEIRGDTEKTFGFYGEAIPKAIRDGKFRGKRVVSAVPTAQTLVQHMSLPAGNDARVDDLVKGQLQLEMGVVPRSIVVKTIRAGEFIVDGKPRAEMIVFAVSHDIVMRYIDLLKQRRLEVVGMHNEIQAMAHAFSHIHRRADDDRITNLILDLGFSGCRTSITHGAAIVFARFFQVGGRTLDQILAEALNCEPTIAHRQRLGLHADAPPPGTGNDPAWPTDQGMGLLGAAFHETAAADGTAAHRNGQVAAVAEERRQGGQPPEIAEAVAATPALEGPAELDGAMDMLAEEIRMAIRYHRHRWPHRRIDRVILLGGESRSPWLCQQLLRRLRLRGQLGSPLARCRVEEDSQMHNVNLRTPQPGWAVAYGLATAPANF